MHTRRSFAPLFLILSLAACASAPARQTPEVREIGIDLAVSPLRARDQIAAAFAANGLPVTSSQPGVIEFRAPRERGVLGQYEVFARAIIVPADCGTHVSLFGEETRYANATSTEGSATRIGPHSTGRAGQVWQKLQAVATALRADSPTTAGTRTRA
jgi:hypothetical protein